MKLKKDHLTKNVLSGHFFARSVCKAICIKVTQVFDWVIS